MLNFISFTPDYWDGPRHNRHYFSRELSKHARVLFVSPPFNVERVIRDLGRWTLSKSGVHEISPTLVNHVHSKWLFTHHRFPTLANWMADQRIRSVRRTAARYGMSDPVLLIWHPHFRDMVGHFKERLVVYYVYDQYSGYAGGSGDSRSPAELELLAKADIVFVLSKELHKVKERDAKRVIHLANAVDYQHFARSRDAATIVPDDIASIPGPRIGYIGTMNEKLNLPILEALSGSHPEWAIVLVGRENYTNAEEKRRFLALVDRPNVHWLPYKPPEQIPSYLKALDVCMMCYVINGWTFYGDPSKLHEYLASGKPTVGVGLSAIKEFADVVTVVDTPDEWVPAVEAALRDTGPEITAKRIETSRHNSYTARIDQFLAVVRDALGEGPGRAVPRLQPGHTTR